MTAKTDTVSYYLYRSRAARATGTLQEERLYADSARLMLQPKVARHPEDALQQLRDKDFILSAVQVCL